MHASVQGLATYNAESVGRPWRLGPSFLFQLGSPSAWEMAQPAPSGSLPKKFSFMLLNCLHTACVLFLGGDWSFHFERE